MSSPQHAQREPLSDTQKDQLLAQAKAESLPLAMQFLGQPFAQTDTEVRFGTKGSVKVVIDGPFAGKVFDFEKGWDGDVIDLLRQAKGLDFYGALDWLRDYFGAPAFTVESSTSSAGPTDEKKAREEKVKAAWKTAVPIVGTPAQLYFAKRLGGLPLPPNVNHNNFRWKQFGESSPVLGCVLAKMFEPTTGRCIGIHQTFVRPDLTRQNRRLHGRMGVIQICGQDGEFDSLLVGEGIETVLAAQTLFPATGAWALVNTAGMSTFRPVSGVTKLIVCADNDTEADGFEGAGQKAARSCADNWSGSDAVVDVRVPKTPGWDFADLLKSLTSAVTEDFDA